jgi:hypothetical protein
MRRDAQKCHMECDGRVLNVTCLDDNSVLVDNFRLAHGVDTTRCTLTCRPAKVWSDKLTHHFFQIEIKLPKIVDTQASGARWESLEATEEERQKHALAYPTSSTHGVKNCSNIEKQVHFIKSYFN